MSTSELYYQPVPGNVNAYAGEYGPFVLYEGQNVNHATEHTEKWIEMWDPVDLEANR